MKRTICFVTIVLTMMTYGRGAAAQRGFFDSLLAFTANGGFGFSFGPMMSEERDAFQVTVEYDDGEERTGKPIHFGLRLGPRIDITPIRKANLKFGLRLGYDIGAVIQELSVGDDYHETQRWSGRLMRYHTLPFGPLLVVGKQRESVNRSIYGTVFLLTGPILGGDYSAAPAAKDFGDVPSDLGNTTFSGWRFDLGGGFGGAISQFLVGVNLTYSPSVIKLDEKIYTKVEQTTSMHEILLEFFLGYHI